MYTREIENVIPDKYKTDKGYNNTGSVVIPLACDPIWQSGRSYSGGVTNDCGLY